MIEGYVDEAARRHMTEGFKRVPIGRLVEVEEIANVNVYITERGMQKYCIRCGDPIAWTGHQSWRHVQQRANDWRSLGTNCALTFVNKME